MVNGRNIPAVTSVENRIEPNTGLVVGRGRYLLECRILSDLVGEIWLAHDEQLAEKTVIRFLHFDWQKDDSAKKRLLREIRAARRLAHPKVIRIYDILEEEELGILAMEYFEGNRWSEVYGDQKKRCEPAEAARLLQQVGDALVYLHQEMQVHGCMHPDLVTVNARGRIKLSGLGLLSVWQRAMASGTAVEAAFLSPQIRAGQIGCEADDLFSAGALLFYLLTGKAPPIGQSDREILVREQLEKNSVPWEQSKLILKCLAENPDERPLNAVDFLARLNCCSTASSSPEMPTGSANNFETQPDSAPVVAPAFRPVTMVPAEPPVQFATSYRSRSLPILFWSLVTIACLTLGYWFNQNPFTPKKHSVQHLRQKTFPHANHSATLRGEAAETVAFIPLTNRLVISTDAGRVRWAGGKTLWRQEGEDIIGQAGEAEDYNDVAWMLCQEPLRRDFELSFEFRGETHAGVAYLSEFRTNGVAGYVMRCDGPVVAGNLCVLIPRKARHELSVPGRKVSIHLEQNKDRAVVLGTMAKKEQLATAWKAGEWNRYLIRAQGNHLIHQLNGITISDVTDNNTKRWVGQSLALFYSPRQTIGKTVEFRKLQLRPL